MPRTDTRGRKTKGANRGSFRPVAVAGPDPRRHVFTYEERSRGGQTTAKRYLVCGRWHTDWLDRCDRKVRNEKGEYEDHAEEEDADRGGESADNRTDGGDDVPL